MKYPRPSSLVAVTLLAVATVPQVMKHRDAARVADRLAVANARPAPAVPNAEVELATPDPALVVRVDQPGGVVASWQTVGGCGAGAGGGSSIGLKWIGRNVHGGLFNLQQQFTYTKIGQPNYPEYNAFSNTLITRDLGEKWNVGVN